MGAQLYSSPVGGLDGAVQTREKIVPQRLGIDTYSLRSQGWDASKFLDYSARLGLDNVHYSDPLIFGAFDSQDFARLKSQADDLGLAIEVGLGSINKYAFGFHADRGTAESQLLHMIDAATQTGSAVVRCFLGDHHERTGDVSLRQHMDECVRTLKAVASQARDAGIHIALENHGGVDLLARELRELVEEAGTDYVGVCLDTGNPAYAGENPVQTVEILAPYAVTSHVRDTAIWESEDGAFAQWTVLGEGNVDLPRILAIMSDKAPNCPIDLETITGLAPSALTYLQSTSVFWSMYPDMLAVDLARFVALAREGKRRGIGPRKQIETAWGVRAIPPELIEPLRAQQLVDFESSVTYARESLGLGVRGR